MLDLQELQETLKPRSYKLGGTVLEDTYSTMLERHPESFDIMVYPALDSLHDEILSVAKPEITLLDRDERVQSFGEPYVARARIVPEENLNFDVTDSSFFEAFHGASEAIVLMLSVPMVKTFSVLQWLEYLSLYNDELVVRTVYIAKNNNIGRTIGAQLLHVCFPLNVNLDTTPTHLDFYEKFDEKELKEIVKDQVGEI